LTKRIIRCININYEQRRSFSEQESPALKADAFVFLIYSERRGTRFMKIEGQVRIPSGCAISAAISKDGNKMSGEMITNSMKPMHDRSNGLGGGFAGYGIYPEYKDFYAFHMFFDSRDTRKECEAFLKERFEIIHSELIPTRKIPAITDEPIIWRYFAAPLKSVLVSLQSEEKEFVAKTVIKINAEMSGAYVFSSGKNMGAFKAVGFPEDVGVFYKLEEYEGYSWTAHGRYPTNTPGWWGGAHPFTLLDYSVVHNGEISSYDANRRFIEMFGYKCTLQTDTEVITYIMDYLLRVQGLTLGETASVIAAPFWSTIAAKTDFDDQKKLTYLRTMFPSLLITGPFSIVLGFEGGLMALNDRLKLRSMVVGEKDDRIFIASEEAAIRTMEPNAENIWSPVGGEPVIVKVKEGAF
jgi:glutamate synthase domain-containing protein 1